MVIKNGIVDLSLQAYDAFVTFLSVDEIQKSRGVNCENVQYLRTFPQH